MTKVDAPINGKTSIGFPALRDFGGTGMAIDSYLKKHSEALVKDLGIARPVVTIMTRTLKAAGGYLP